MRLMPIIVALMLGKPMLKTRCVLVIYKYFSIKLPQLIDQCSLGPWAPFLSRKFKLNKSHQPYYALVLSSCIWSYFFSSCLVSDIRKPASKLYHYARFYFVPNEVYIGYQLLTCHLCSLRVSNHYATTQFILPFQPIEYWFRGVEL